ncbi:MAG: peptide ABC transporter substrate-binding protein, partial [Polyangiaceae bacterium]|nr:peptide ABC transporter substrate-binding protein [Polyangiaceae bacterium]
DLQDSLGVAYLFVSHDLQLVRHVSHRVAVMYLGRIVEQAEVGELYAHPRHPYTVALLGAAPRPDPSGKRVQLVLQGDVPSPIDPPAGCPFHPRCSRAIAGRCDVDVPHLDAMNAGDTRAPEHRVACWNPHP